MTDEQVVASVQDGWTGAPSKRWWSFALAVAAAARAEGAREAMVDVDEGVAEMVREAEERGHAKGLDDACRAMCGACDGKVPSKVPQPRKHEHTWRHDYVRPCDATEYCDGSPIHALRERE